MDHDEIERLYNEVTLIGRRVGLLKSIVENAEDPSGQEMFQEEIRKLQEKAMLHLEKIKELEKELEQEHE